MVLSSGHVYLAPAGQHLTVRRSGSEVRLQLSSSPSGLAHMPSVDVMMQAVAGVFGSQAMGIILTGMGADGALGMQAISRQGGLTLGQGKATCAVYGMPRVCAEMGILRNVIPLPEVTGQILSALRYRDRNS